MDQAHDKSGLLPAPPSASAQPESSDAALVMRVCGGDEPAFEELFERHRRRVALIAGRFFRQREQVEEVLQETFMKAYFALADFTPGKDAESAFAAWLARIAFNVCYGEVRRQRRRPESALGDLSADEATRLRKQLDLEGVEGDIESAAVARDLVAKLLARLAPEDRLTLVLLEVEGLSVAEIAELTGWSASKVKVRAHRARAALRRDLSRFL